VPVTSAAQVLPDAHDNLAPLPAGVTPALSADDVLSSLLQTEGDNAAYLKDSSKLTVEVGLYTDAGLMNASGTPTKNVVSYVFEGGHALCPPSAGPPVSSGSHRRLPANQQYVRQCLSRMVMTEELNSSVFGALREDEVSQRLPHPRRCDVGDLT
jgi:hypothetical protein